MSQQQLEMPAPEANGFIPTLNKQGYMTSMLDFYMKSFVEYAATCKLPVVDIGAAYGIASIPALQNGAQVIAVDTDERHLQILRNQVPSALQKNLQTLCASFPENLNFRENSIGAFLLARVVHFFAPEKLTLAAHKLYEWLTPGGNVFLTAETPYLKNWRTFIPIYEKRRAAGNLWAGYVENVMEFAPERGKMLPPTMLFLDPETLKKTFAEAGFIIEKVDFLPRPEFPEDLRLDNRESVGLICRKKS